MIEHTDVTVGFVKRSYGGAAAAIKYAKRRKKTVILL